MIGVTLVSDCACAASNATPTNFQNRAIPANASCDAVLRYPGGSVSTIS